eukprot:6699475-Lingulodinium_polyedra.AAC.1
MDRWSWKRVSKVRRGQVWEVDVHCALRARVRKSEASCCSRLRIYPSCISPKTFTEARRPVRRDAARDES